MRYEQRKKEQGPVVALFNRLDLQPLVVDRGTLKKKKENLNIVYVNLSPFVNLCSFTCQTSLLTPPFFFRPSRW